MWFFLKLFGFILFFTRPKIGQRWLWHVVFSMFLYVRNIDLGYLFWTLQDRDLTFGPVKGKFHSSLSWIKVNEKCTSISETLFVGQCHFFTKTSYFLSIKSHYRVLFDIVLAMKQLEICSVIQNDYKSLISLGCCIRSLYHYMVNWSYLWVWDC